MVTHQRLHNSMVCGIHVGVQWEDTLSFTVVCRVALWSDDPVLTEDIRRNETVGLISPGLLVAKKHIFKGNVKNLIQCSVALRIDIQR